MNSSHINHLHIEIVMYSRNAIYSALSDSSQSALHSKLFHDDLSDLSVNLLAICHLFKRTVHPIRHQQQAPLMEAVTIIIDHWFLIHNF